MIKKLIKKFLPYKAIRIRPASWEERYSEGKWDRIREINELARYSIIIGYCQFLKQAGSILDVGCGEGILCERLCNNQYSRYLGIDGSRVGIDRANVNNNERDRLLVVRIEDFITLEKFDVIIFNESLYYLEKPVKILQHYEGFLEENGVIIVSMHKTYETLKIWKQIEKHYCIKDAVDVRNEEEVCWIIKVLEVL